MFIGEADLEVLPRPDYWTLKQDMVWRSAQLETTVPAGFITDLASIPTVFRNILDVEGRSREPAILHDWLYCCQKTSRTFADDMLRLALIGYGETPQTAFVYWSGVRIGGWVGWGKRLKRGGSLQLDDFVNLSSYLTAKTNLSIKEMSA